MGTFSVISTIFTQNRVALKFINHNINELVHMLFLYKNTKKYFSVHTRIAKEVSIISNPLFTMKRVTCQTKMISQKLVKERCYLRASIKMTFYCDSVRRRLWTPILVLFIDDSMHSVSWHIIFTLDPGTRGSFIARKSALSSLFKIKLFLIILKYIHIYTNRNASAAS